jgi:hypothetical protein
VGESHHQCSAKLYDDNVHGTSNGRVGRMSASCGAVYKDRGRIQRMGVITLHTFTGSRDGSEPTLIGVVLVSSGDIFGATATGGDLSRTLDGPQTVAWHTKSRSVRAFSRRGGASGRLDTSDRQDNFAQDTVIQTSSDQHPREPWGIPVTKCSKI